MPIDTKSIIANHYLELSTSKSIDRISVKELVQVCGISRQAFYYHFQDIYEVAAYTNELQVQKILDASHGADDLNTALRVFITFFSENLSTTRKQLESQKYRQFEALLTQMINGYLTALVKKSTRTLTPSELNTAIEFSTGGVYHMLMQRAGRSKEDDDRLAEELADILRGNLACF